MSGYYAGYHGSALVLKQNEYDEMIKMYQKKIVQRLKQPLKDDFICLVVDEEGLLSEYPFIRSAFQECDPNEILENEANAKIFDIVNISPDNCDGMLLIPYCNNGELHWEHNTAISLRAKNLYVIFSDFQLDNPSTFFTKPYKSYDSFVSEFKEKLENYLPNDFNWDEHIGSFSYSCYV